MTRIGQSVRVTNKGQMDLAERLRPNLKDRTIAKSLLLGLSENILQPAFVAMIDGALAGEKG